MGRDDDGNPTFQLWPAREYAALCAVEDWSAYEPTEIRLDHLLDDLLPKVRPADAALPVVAVIGVVLFQPLLVAKSAALQANNATTVSDQRQILRDQVLRVRDRILGLANGAVDDRYMFGGANASSVYVGPCGSAIRCAASSAKPSASPRYRV